MVFFESKRFLFESNVILTLKCQYHKTVKCKFPTNCLSVFDLFVILALKGLRFLCQSDNHREFCMVVEFMTIF